jgi:hypothetical protein
MLLATDFQRPVIYWDPCHGVPPMVVAAQDFVAGQIVVVAVAVIVLLFAI